MKQTLDEKEVLILECIKESDEAIGSWYLVEKMEEKDIFISSATIGRILTHLEKLGYVEKEGSKGRNITNKGIEALERTQTINKINFHKEELEKLINTKVLEDFLMVLQARKAIERETVVLAAQNITEAEIKRMDEILKTQEANYANKLSIATDDINFHRAIAKASRNTVLESLYSIISNFGQQSNLFEFIRAQVKSPYNVSHRKIFEALRKHDEAEAEKAMLEHMQNLVKDVTAYWDIYKEDSEEEVGPINE
ncbi:MAG TPA: FCD domain-containing protein [Clostridia bacterium]|nr:FCD domain-containing protein [Clostridia bacterium]